MGFRPSLHIIHKCYGATAPNGLCPLRVNAVSQEEAIRLIVSGQGGTGKSRVVDVIHKLVSAQAPANLLRVVLAAPTGCAACDVGGTKIHHILCLPVEHGKPADYRNLNQSKTTEIRKADTITF